MSHGGAMEFLYFLIASFSLYGIFFLSAAALLSVLTFVNPIREDFGWMAALSIGLGPALLGWGFTMALWLFPGHDQSLYVWGATLVCVSIALVRPVYLVRSTRDALRSHFALFQRRFTYPLLMALVGGISSILLGLLLIASLQPVTGNDPLEYAQAARLLADARTVEIYPFVDSAKSNGFFAPWTHPLGYINLLTLGYMIQGSTEAAGIIRLVAPWFAISSVIAIWTFAARIAPLAGPVAALLLLSTPLYFQMTAQFHIDTMRIFTFMSAFLALYAHVSRPTYGTAAIVGLAVGMAHFSHSSGILTLPILLPLYLIVSGLDIRKQLSFLSVIIVMGVATTVPRWLDNYAHYGSLAADQVKVWAMPEVHFREYLSAVRLLTTPLDQIVYGILKGLSYPLQFGGSYYLLIASLIWLTVKYHRRLNPLTIWRDKLWLRPDLVVFSLWVLAGFYGIVVLSVFLDMDLIIKNSRYILTVQPFVSIVVAALIAAALKEKTQIDKQAQGIGDKAQENPTWQR